MPFLDSIHGLISRRILLNYRIDPAVLQRQLPAPFRPKCYNGQAIGGICMIRFGSLRPRGVPSWLGISSENAAHRFAVEWTQDGQTREGVYIPRRDTASWFNHRLGGRVFPGIFNRSTFHVQETPAELSLQILRPDNTEELAFSARRAPELPPTSIFPSLHQAAAFFSLGATGYSATHHPNHYHGMELKCLDWTLHPLQITTARSSFFDNPTRFPPGSHHLDSALLMLNITHEWHTRPDLYHSPDHTSLTTSPQKPPQPPNLT